MDKSTEPTMPLVLAAATQSTGPKGVPLAAYTSSNGVMYQGTVEAFLTTQAGQELKTSVDLIFTSPPFPLTQKKRYGNRTGAEYLEWMGEVAAQLGGLLKPSGSLVIELGNAWEPGEPTMSLLPLETLVEVVRRSGLHLCQQFIYENTARLPGPAQWVNVERIRAKDVFTHVWWLGKSIRPKADNRRVLTPYSDRMRDLLETGEYNAGTRPSGHYIGATSFAVDNGGAIPGNVIHLANTGSDAKYVERCTRLGVERHPARMPPKLVEWFIRFLTDKGDLVLDPFAGSNTTGAVAEELDRRWVAIEPNMDYVRGSMGRFDDSAISAHYAADAGPAA